MSSARAIRTPISLTAEVVADEAGLNALAPEWDDLVSQSDQRVFFLRSSWNLLWWGTFRPPGASLFLVTARDSHGRLAGLAPLYLRLRRTAGIPHVRELLFFGTGVYAHTSEFLDVIARRGAEKQVAFAIADLLQRSSAWDKLCLRQLPASSAILPHLAARLGAAVEPAGRAHFIDTSAGWDRVAAKLSRSTRKNLDYETRRLLKTHNCELRRVTLAHEVEEAMESLIRLHQARWNARGEPGSFAIAGVEPFLRAAASAALAGDHLRLWTLAVDGTVAAALLGFLENGVVHYFQAGFDTALAHYSIGRVMLGLCVRDSIDDPAIREFNFMGGYGQYRDQWTPDCRDLVDLTMLRSGARASVYAGIDRLTGLGKSALRAALPAPLRAAGHRLLLRRHLSRGSVGEAG